MVKDSVASGFVCSCDGPKALGLNGLEWPCQTFWDLAFLVWLGPHLPAICEGSPDCCVIYGLSLAEGGALYRVCQSCK